MKKKNEKTPHKHHSRFLCIRQIHKSKEFDGKTRSLEQQKVEFPVMLIATYLDDQIEAFSFQREKKRGEEKKEERKEEKKRKKKKKKQKGTKVLQWPGKDRIVGPQKCNKEMS